MTYGIGGLITSVVRGVKIRLNPESIYRIFDIAPIGLRVYESKIWPIVPRFEPREAIQRIFLTSKCPWDGQTLNTQIDNH